LASSRNVIIAGGGIGGLTAALALAQRGFRAVVLDQASTLEETGAGIQLSPNASRVLIGLGLEQRLIANAVVPEAVEIRAARGQILARIPLGDDAAERYAAPYWVTHRGDLQAVLIEAVRANPDIALTLGTRVEDFVVHGNGVTVACRHGPNPADETGIALICADGLWSRLRLRLGHRDKPAFRRRVAWRALIPAASVAPYVCTEVVQLWLGQGAHLVHYPVKLGTLINVVAIVDDDRWQEPGWNEPGAREEIIARFSSKLWAAPARELIAQPERWHKWALYDLPPIRKWGDGPVTMLGDAAHPMLPFLAQGAAMAIEDGFVLAREVSLSPDDLNAALQRYEAIRRPRTGKVQLAARTQANIFHLTSPAARLRRWLKLDRFTKSDAKLLNRDWLYEHDATAAEPAVALPSR
jgi:salicylate hydroxylase